MKPRVIWVDMDDTICNFKSKFYSLNKEFILLKYTKILYYIILMKILNIKVYPSVKYHHFRFGFFKNLKPIEGSIETISELIIMGYDVRFLTKPSIKNPMCYIEKRLWIEKYFGLNMCEKLYISPDKTEEVKENDILIDDNFWDVKGELILFGKNPYDNWKKVFNYITENKK